MRAIILAAGSGSRLGQHTLDIPKALVDINGKSILERQISLLKKQGVDEISVVTGYKKEKHVLSNVEYFFNFILKLIYISIQKFNFFRNTF